MKQTQPRQYPKVPELLRHIYGFYFSSSEPISITNSPTIALKPERQRDLVTLVEVISENAESLFADNQHGFFKRLEHASADPLFSNIVKQYPYHPSPRDPLRIICRLEGYLPNVTPGYTRFRNGVERAAQRFAQEGKSKLKFESGKASDLYQDSRYIGQAIKMESIERSGFKVVVEIHACRLVEDSHHPSSQTSDFCPDLYKERLISKINNSGGWNDERFAKEELERYEQRQKEDDERGSW